MKIAQVAPLIYDTPPLRAGGTERVVADLCNSLVALGHDVDLFATSGSRTDARLAPQGEAISSIDGAPPSLPAAREAIMLRDVADRMSQYDIIHCHTEFFHAAVLREVAYKTVTTIHWRVDEPDRQCFLDAFDGLNLIAISDAQRRMLPEAHRASPVVHHGIDEDRFRLIDSRGAAPYCAFLGRLTDQKGPDRAIRAARAAGLSVKLAGNMDVGNPKYFERVVAPLLGDDVELVGEIDDVAKQHFLGHAGVLAFPIDWPEPFGLVMIEAMACGTPVVAFDRGAAAEIIEAGRTGFVVDTEEEFAQALIKAVELDRREVRAAFEERFTATRMALDHLAFYGRISDQKETFDVR